MAASLALLRAPAPGRLERRVVERGFGLVKQGESEWPEDKQKHHRCDDDEFDHTLASWRYD
ncbi:MAG: hypothetical protein U5P41_12445 [Gammaproteobacteria bacterium]|nr:hypothetical protein [Gammaproteobacteria bacterium]